MSSAGFRLKYRGMLWSNRNATDVAWIRAALARPRFDVLLDAARAFGLDVLEREWRALEADPQLLRVKPTVSRILANIRRGHELARA